MDFEQQAGVGQQHGDRIEAAECHKRVVEVPTQNRLHFTGGWGGSGEEGTFT